MPVINCDANNISVASDFPQEMLPCTSHLPLTSNAFNDMQCSVAVARSMSQTGTNYSEQVEVPSSEHVAEIVGRQG